MQAGIERLLFLQLALQVENLRARLGLLGLGHLPQTRDLFLAQALQIGDALALLLDQQRSLLPLLLIAELGTSGRLLPRLFGVPGILGHHLQALGRHRRHDVFVDQQPERIAGNSIT